MCSVTAAVTAVDELAFYFYISLYFYRGNFHVLSRGGAGGKMFFSGGDTSEKIKTRTNKLETGLTGRC